MNESYKHNEKQEKQADKHNPYKVHYRETAEHYRQEDLKSNWKKCQVTFKEIIFQLRTDFSTITIKSQESKLIS